MNEDPLQTPLQFVTGTGPQRAELLAKLNLLTVADLLWSLPRDVLDLTRINSIEDLNEDHLCTVRGQVSDIDARQLRNNKSIAKILLVCDGGYLTGVWFNQRWVIHKYKIGDWLLFSGKPKRKAGRWEISHPRVQVLEEDSADAHGGILPCYRLTEGLSMHEMRRIARNTVEQYVPLVSDPLPKTFREEQHLLDLQSAIKGIHTAESYEEYEQGRYRLLFDDLLEFQLGMALRRRNWQREQHAPVLPSTSKIDARIRRLFPFQFTEGQNQAVQEITQDLSQPRAMHRLLQADVGAGKTAVAVYATLVAVAAGYQTVLMAPTEVLANQHWETIDQILKQSRVKRLLLTGKLTATRRRSALEQIANGDVQLIIGTQAVIQKDVQFHQLGLVVIDEQHKFGVMQRARFSSHHLLSNDEITKPTKSPHVLVMTATPIPRSLCLTQFGDLDITTISDLPPGRQRVITSRVPGPTARQKAWRFIRDQLKTGRQLFVVCPRIDETEDAPEGELSLSAEQTFRELSENILNEFQIGLAHGQLDSVDKQDVMERFRKGKLNVLVATTVVEVGIDVPNATLMVIVNAEKFGLSQLHQLRGRISRGAFQGYCFLFSDAESDEANARLTALERFADGFKIAETDFELRGPGDVLGTQQHGKLPLRIADLLRDQEILIAARKAAFQLVNSGNFDEGQYADLKRNVLARFAQTLLLPKSG